jgi:hypothetical protein
MRLLPDLSFLAFLFAPPDTAADTTLPAGSAAAPEAPSAALPWRGAPESDDAVFAGALPTLSRSATEAVVIARSAPNADASDANSGAAATASVETSQGDARATATGADDPFAERFWSSAPDLDGLFDQSAPPAEHGLSAPATAVASASQAGPIPGPSPAVGATPGAQPAAATGATALALATNDEAASLMTAASALPSGGEASGAAMSGPTSGALSAAQAMNHGALSAQQFQAPLSFEANLGQTDASVDYLARGQGYTAFLTPTGLTLASAGQGGSETAVRLQLVESNPGAAATGLDQLQARSNYFIGNDPSQWVTNVPNYGQVSYSGVYQGIDLVYHSSSTGGLEYDFRVAPGADPGTIAFQVQGADSLRVAPDGSLVAHTAAGDLVQAPPTLYQPGPGGQRQAVDGNFALRPDNTVSFQVGSYDPTRELVIDPGLAYSTFLGGTGDDYGEDIAADGNGNVYVTGYTTSPNYPATPGAFMVAPAGFTTNMAFVTELDVTGNLVYSTYLGGPGVGPAALATNQGFGIAVDSTGAAYITGVTNSPNFPVTPGAFQVALGGMDDAFVTKLQPNGAALAYSTYLGGNMNDGGNGIAVDAGGQAYVTGYTTSANFPVVAAIQGAIGGGVDAFVTELNATGAAPVYSTYLGGRGSEWGYGIVVLNGQAYVTGGTNSNNFPTFPAPPAPLAQGALGGQTDAFVTAIKGGGVGFVYSTYLGGAGDDEGYGITVDSQGNAYVTGWTSGLFPTTPGALQRGVGGGNDAFVTEVDPFGGSWVYSTYLGGNGDDFGHGIVLVAGQNALYDVVVTGQTDSTNFPVNPVWPAAGAPGPWWNALNNGMGFTPSDAFITRLTPVANVPLTFSGYLGDANDDAGMGLAVFNNTYSIVGWTASPGFPVTAAAVQPVFGGGTSDAFLTQLM